MADLDRFRSFAERYVIERANGFRKGFEREDAWEATLDARTVFNNIGRVAKEMDAPYQEAAGIVGQAAVNQAMQAAIIPNRPRPQHQAPLVQMVAAPEPSMIKSAMQSIAQRLPGMTATATRGRQKSWRK